MDTLFAMLVQKVWRNAWGVIFGIHQPIDVTAQYIQTLLTVDFSAVIANGLRNKVDLPPRCSYF